MPTSRPWRAVKHLPPGSADTVDQIVGLDETDSRIIAVASCDDERAKDDFEFIVRSVAAVDAIVQALYGDRVTGELTGENTISEKSCADFVDVVTEIVSNQGLTPKPVLAGR